MVFDKRYRPIDIKIAYRFKYIKRVNYMMKKKIQLGSMLALFFSGVLSAQSVGINTDTPNKSSVMHLAPFNGRKYYYNVHSTSFPSQCPGIIFYSTTF